MKILLVNKFYYNRGGDCVALLSQEALLKRMGHEVALFSMQYPQNLPTEWSKYFPSEVSFSGSLSSKISAVKRIFGMGDVQRNFIQLLNDFKPDIVHLHNIHSYLSPILAKIAHSRNIKVVWTLHDYKLLCPSYACLRNNTPCELCYDNKLEVIKHRCMKGSLAASAIASLEAIYWSKQQIEKTVSSFIAPSRFMKLKMIQGGFQAEKIEVINNFMDVPNNIIAKKDQPSDYFIYVGRLSPEKGIEGLLKAIKKTKDRLVIVGGGPLQATLQEKYSNVDHIEFKGHCSRETTFELLINASAMIIPSICYDNNPFSVIESLSLGVPVLGSNMGGIPELIEEGVNGYIFDPYKEGSLEETLAVMKGNNGSFDRVKIAERAKERFSSHKYYEKIQTLYSI